MTVFSYLTNYGALKVTIVLTNTVCMVIHFNPLSSSQIFLCLEHNSGINCSLDSEPEADKTQCSRGHKWSVACNGTKERAKHGCISQQYEKYSGSFDSAAKIGEKVKITNYFFLIFNPKLKLVGHSFEGYFKQNSTSVMELVQLVCSITYVTFPRIFGQQMSCMTTHY